MADYMSWQETTITQVYGLDVPTNAVEVSKMIAGACQKFRDAHGREPYDDEITITVTDDAVRASFPVLSQRHHEKAP